MPPLGTELTGNADCPWDEFDPDVYTDLCYRILRDDDRLILQRIRDFFADSLGHRRGLRGADVGPGSNLYPALALLPFCDEITLVERGAANRRWLRVEIAGPDGYARSWDPFWTELATAAPYRQVAQPRQALRERARVIAGDVFTLERNQWDVGTMCFVAESITARSTEFRRAVARFLGALRPSAPFAAAFMADSLGYTVAAHRFPAVAVSRTDVAASLSPLASLHEVTVISSDTPLRDGYSGMILALGRARLAA